MYRESGVTRRGASSLDSGNVRIAAAVYVGVLAGHEGSWAGSTLYGAAPSRFANAVYALAGVRDDVLALRALVARLGNLRRAD